MWVLGVDGCRSGWLAVFRSTDGGPPRAQLFKTFADVVAQQVAKIAVDIPIGLSSVSEKGGRKADREARKFLGRRRGSSVFPAPSRSTLLASSFEDACQIEYKNSKPPKMISKQTYNILCKIRQVDQVANDKRGIVYECHPEVSFCVMKGQDLQSSKKTAAGLNERRALLGKFGYCEDFMKTRIGRPGDHSRDDLVDACVAAWTAERILTGIGTRFPEEEDFDGRNLDMAIWA